MNMHTSAGQALMAALAPQDIQTICRIAHLPLPTPDVPLSVIVEQAGRTVGDIRVVLERSSEISAQIAAAALRGGITRLAPDPRLSPRPWPRSPVASPRTADEATRRVAPPPPPRVRPEGRVLVFVAPNPKRPGSASRDRYALYEVGLTEAQLTERGILPADVRWDTQRGFLTWETTVVAEPGPA